MTHDFIKDRFAISNRTLTPEGYLIIKDCRLAKPGILKYAAAEIPNMVDKPADLNPFQVIRVLRTEESLFDTDFLESLKSKPITLKHPSLLLNADVVKDHGVGLSKDDLHKDSMGYLVGSLVITDADAVKSVTNGVKELSLGYTGQITYSPGSHPTFGEYDAVMDTLMGNHIAIVPKGRNGSDCKISDSDKQTNTGKNMPTPDNTVQVMCDGISIDCSPQAKQVIDKLTDANTQLVLDAEDKKSSHEDAVSKLKDKHKEEMSKLEGERDVAKSQVKDAAGIDALVAERSTLIDQASKLLKDFDAKGKSNIEIKTEVVKDSASLNVEGKDETYITACFDMLTAKKADGTDDQTQMFKDHAKANASTGQTVSQIARQKRIDDNKNGSAS